MRVSRRLLIVGGVLMGLHLFTVLAGLFAPYHYAEQNRSFPLAPPMRLHVIDGNGRWHLRPFVYPWTSGDGETYQEDTTSRLPLRFFVRGSSYQILGLFSSRWHLFGVDEPGRVFILGTDSVGRDYFSRLLYGAQISLTAGLVGTTISLGIALALGGLSGYCGGWLDDIAMRSAEVFLSLPWLYLLFAARAFLPLDVGPAVTFMVIVILLGLVGWAGPTRLVRGVVLIAREREFVDAARSFGASHLYLFWRHVFPQTLSVLLTQAALLVPMYVLAEVTLSFVGLGVAEPVPSWGNMLAALQQYHVLASSAWMFAPGVALVLITWLYHSLLSTLERRPVAVEL